MRPNHQSRWNRHSNTGHTQSSRHMFLPSEEKESAMTKPFVPLADVLEAVKRFSDAQAQALACCGTPYYAEAAGVRRLKFRRLIVLLRRAGLR